MLLKYLTVFRVFSLRFIETLQVKSVKLVYKKGRLMVQIKCISKRRKKHISLISKTYTQNQSLRNNAKARIGDHSLPPMKLHQNHSKPDRLILNQRTKSYIPISYIMLLKGKVNYTSFLLRDGREKVVAHTLKYFEQFLEIHGFQRVHRASMINPHYVKSYNELTSIVTMDNQISV